MKRFSLYLILAVLACPMSQAFAVSEPGALFLMISPDARSTGMGEAAVALVDGAMATVWNPGALGYVDQRKFTFSYFKHLPSLADDLYYLNFSYVQPIKGIGTIGVSVPYLSLGEQNRTNESGDDLSVFNSFDMAISISYGTQLAKTLSVGVHHQDHTESPVERGDGRRTGERGGDDICRRSRCDVQSSPTLDPGGRRSEPGTADHLHRRGSG